MGRSVGGLTAWRRWYLSVVAALPPAILVASPVAAHGQPAAAPSLSTLIDGWSFDVLFASR